MGACEGRFREAREKLEAYLEERKDVFGKTKAYAAAERLAADLLVRIDRAVTRSGQTIVLDWMGVDVPAAETSPQPATGPGPFAASADVPTVDPQWRFAPPYPNPFN